MVLQKQDDYKTTQVTYSIFLFHYSVKKRYLQVYRATDRRTQDTRYNYDPDFYLSNRVVYHLYHVGAGMIYGLRQKRDKSQMSGDCQDLLNYPSTTHFVPNSSVQEYKHTCPHAYAFTDASYVTFDANMPSTRRYLSRIFPFDAVIQSPTKIPRNIQSYKARSQLCPQQRYLEISRVLKLSKVTTLSPTKIPRNT